MLEHVLLVSHQSVVTAVLHLNDAHYEDANHVLDYAFS